MKPKVTMELMHNMSHGRFFFKIVDWEQYTTRCVWEGEREMDQETRRWGSGLLHISYCSESRSHLVEMFSYSHKAEVWWSNGWGNQSSIRIKLSFLQWDNDSNPAHCKLCLTFNIHVDEKVYQVFTDLLFSRKLWIPTPCNLIATGIAETSL